MYVDEPPMDGNIPGFNISKIDICPFGVYQRSFRLFQGDFSKDIHQRSRLLCFTQNDHTGQTGFKICPFLKWAQVLSLGDCENPNIAKRLVEEEIITKEVDVLILAHHGADNGFTTTDFLKALNPRVAVCACDWDNIYSHPSDKVRSMLSNLGIKYYSTKAGDIIAQSVDKYNFKVSNYITNNEKKDSVETFTNKTYYTQD